MKRKNWPADGSIKYRAYFNKGSTASFCLEGLGMEKISQRAEEILFALFTFLGRLSLPGF